MRNLIAKSLLVATMVVGLGVRAAEIPENHQLGDVMWLLADAYGALGEFSKKTPATVEDKEFNRQATRARASQYLLKIIDEKKGTIEEGKLVPGELTPGKFTTVEGEELAAMMDGFSAALTNVSDAFGRLGTELNVQMKKAPQERSLLEYRKGLAALDSAFKKAHEAFKPPHS